MKRIFIVHGWEFSPEMNWYPWLKRELEKKDFKVLVPAMPNPEAPVIKTWVDALAHAVGTPDKQTFFIGHSIGCQTILRYLSTVTSSVGGVVLVAPWLTLSDAALPDKNYRAIAKPWLETRIKQANILQHAGPIIAIFCDDDPYVPMENERKFKESFGAVTKTISGKGHFTSEDGVTEIREALAALLELST
ncbi:MAG TPA: alpha/beta fold hydrolase [Candidatus Binatia bacterium]|nr:alpha/beta fold hydrolase [Candidatus Binatia bacterium]